MTQMKELYEKVAGDCVLQNKFQDIMNEAEKAGQEETKEKLINFAKEAGFTIRVEEMLDYFKKLSEGNKGELKDSELDMVAGGKGASFWINTALNMGYGCAITSAAVAFMAKLNCEEILDHNPFS